MAKKEITEKAAVEAYNMLIDFCSLQSECEGCPLASQDPDYGDCIMEQGDVPRGWPSKSLYEK